ncbi:MAG: hypothetical protein JWQ38_2484 [Flavipsychrobacter sp.]|nr:hypothetical protein [Flavipsychrobacter sp.]
MKTFNFHNKFCHSLLSARQKPEFNISDEKKLLPMGYYLAFRV